MVSRSRSAPTDSLAKLYAARSAVAPVVQAALDAADSLDANDRHEASAALDLLEQLGCDDQTLASALWFYIALHHAALWQRAEPHLPPAVARLVGGQMAAERVWQIYVERGTGGEGLRRLLLAIIRDLRVVFVLLARQLARLRMADALPPEQARALAQLTADIHAPLANRLGIWQLKWELEDLAFRQLHPDLYKRVAHLLDQRRTDREQFIRSCVELLASALKAAGITAELVGRPKHIYSIWRKMQRKGLAFDELYDISAVRVMVGDVAECYAALGVVHGLWPHIPKEFDDYIARPKANGYQSLHTAVFGPGGRTLEVQIRTREMHRICELGMAAHWLYKEGGKIDSSFEQRIAWMRQLLDSRADNDVGLLADFRTELVEDRVYLLTPRGDVFDLPRGSTVLDFAYHIHTEVGHRCRGAKVNGRIVPLTYQPHSGDRIEILTGKISEPSRNWLSPHHGYLNSPRARDKVKAWFRRGRRAANLTAGRAILERELKRLALEPADLAGLPARLGLKNLDELLEALALGDVTPGRVVRLVQEQRPPTVPTLTPVRSHAAHAGGLHIEGVGNLLTTLAHCCQPVPGDVVRGFITRGRGVSVHRADCPSLARLKSRSPERIIAVQWSADKGETFQVDLGVHGYDRNGFQQDVTAVVSGAQVPIIASSTRTDPQRGEVDMRLTLRVHDFDQLSEIMDRLSGVANVTDVHRLST